MTLTIPRLVVLMLGASFGTQWCSGQVSIQWLDLPAGAQEGIATDISADGNFVVGHSQFSADGRRHAVLWEPGGGSVTLPSVTEYGVPANIHDPVVDANGSTVAATNSLSSGPHAARWTTVAGTTQDLGAPLGYLYSEAYAIRADGQMIAGQGFNGGNDFDPAVWNGSWQLLTHLPDTDYGRALGISADGSRIVGSLGGATVGTSAVLWTDGVPQNLDPLRTTVSEAIEISADGSTVVGVHGSQPFVWTAATGIQQLGGGDGTARGVSADGSTVVGEGFSTSAFIWDATHGRRSLADVLEDAGITNVGSLRDALAISDDGTKIVGSGFAPNSNVLQPYLVTIPEPAGALLCLAASALLGRRR